ncbi:MAG: hypothetical protein QM790_19170 [Nibricoccus sp.]
MATAEQDDLRAQVFYYFSSAVDIDDPEIRTIFENVIKKCKAEPNHPVTYGTVRMYEAHTMVRLGQSFDFAVTFADVTEARSKQVLQFAEFRSFLQKKDKPRLERIVNNMDTGTLMSPYTLSTILPVLKFLNREKELRAVTELAIREQRSALVSSWARRDFEEATRTVHLARILGSSAYLPPSWVKDMTTGSGDRRVQLLIRIVKAELDQNWPSSSQKPPS